MKKLSIILPSAFAGVLVSAMVFAAPQAEMDKASSGVALDRATAYRIATAD